MKDALQWFVFGFFGVIAAFIIFVRAGQLGGATGGKQTADIINAAGGSVASLASSLEGG